MIDVPLQPPAPVYRWLAGPIEANAAATIDRVRGRPPASSTWPCCPTSTRPATCASGRPWPRPTGSTPRPSAATSAAASSRSRSTADGVDLLRDPARAGGLLRRLGQVVPTSRRNRHHLMPMPDLGPLSHGSLDAVRADVGRLQLGTLGGGNHFVELGADVVTNQLWLTVHTGSRAMGQAVRGHHVATAATHRSAGMMGRRRRHARRAGPTCTTSTWARAYAAANRDAIVSAVVGDAVGRRHHRGWRSPSDATTTTWRPRTHDGRAVWVHRKGAMPAGVGAAGVVPGSMGTRTAHVVGRGCAASLASAAHGGRPGVQPGGGPRPLFPSRRPPAAPRRLVRPPADRRAAGGGAQGVQGCPRRAGGSDGADRRDPPPAAAAGIQGDVTRHPRLATARRAVATTGNAVPQCRR